MLGAGAVMDKKSLEFSCLLGWLRTFPLQSQASTAAELSDGLAMSEVLVQIEPATFTPTWFAGILKSEQSNYETLGVLLNMLLHYYRHNLSEDCVAGDNLPIPNLTEIGSSDTCLPVEDVCQFLKLILGVAVTCTNKLLFINKIQSLDETTQHALTACIVSFISTKDWSERVATNETISEAKLSPSGDEVWAQRCHELDYQVALLREERSNLMNENEELCGKVKAAQSLSRKDSMKSRHFETELAHVKDEFDRLKLEYENTRQHVAVIDQKLKSGTKEQEEIQKLCENINLLKSDLEKLQSSYNSRENGQKWLNSESVRHRLESHQDLISELKTELNYQVTLQARMNQDMDMVKDQVDVLREQVHSCTRYTMDIGDIKSRVTLLERSKEEMMMTKTMSAISTDSLDNVLMTQNMSVTSTDSIDVYVTNVSQANNQLDETTVLPSQMSIESSLGCMDDSKLRKPAVQQDILVCHSDAKEMLEDENDEEISESTETDPTHPLTYRSQEDIPEENSEHSTKIDIDNARHRPNDEGHLRDVEDWNFSSVATIDDKSFATLDEKSLPPDPSEESNLDEDSRQKAMIDELYRIKKKPKNNRKAAIDNDEEKPTDCFNTMMLQFFVKVFD